MWPNSGPSNRGTPRLFPNWSISHCNQFLDYVRKETDLTSIEEKSSLILKAAVQAKEQRRAEADILFKMSKLLSEAAYESAGTPDIIFGVNDEDLIDAGLISGMLQVGANTFWQAQKEWRDEPNPEIAAVRCLIAREQLGICKAAIGINKKESTLAALISQSKVSSIRLFLDSHKDVRRIFDEFDNSWLGDRFKKKVALPLAFLIAHILIVEKKPDPEVLFQFCGMCISDSVFKCLCGNIEDVIDSMSNINQQISGA